VCTEDWQGPGVGVSTAEPRDNSLSSIRVDIDCPCWPARRPKASPTSTGSESEDGPFPEPSRLPYVSRRLVAPRLAGLQAHGQIIHRRQRLERAGRVVSRRENQRPDAARYPLGSCRRLPRPEVRVPLSVPRAGTPRVSRLTGSAAMPCAAPALNHSTPPSGNTPVAPLVSSYRTLPSKRWVTWRCPSGDAGRSSGTKARPCRPDRGRRRLSTSPSPPG